MTDEKNFAIRAFFDSKMDEVAFWDLYHTFVFLYKDAKTRESNLIKMSTRCRKKKINVDFKYYLKKSENTEE